MYRELNFSWNEMKTDHTIYTRKIPTQPDFSDLKGVTVVLSPLTTLMLFTGLAQESSLPDPSFPWKQ